MLKDTRFRIGQLVVTPGALDVLSGYKLNGADLVLRHAKGDWGDVSANDAAANEAALQTGSRVLSAYNLADGTRILIITEADRSATTILLPSEY